MRAVKRAFVARHAVSHACQSVPIRSTADAGIMSDACSRSFDSRRAHVIKSATSLNSASRAWFKTMVARSEGSTRWTEWTDIFPDSM